jgi:hypothetical protein
MEHIIVAAVPISAVIGVLAMKKISLDTYKAYRLYVIIVFILWMISLFLLRYSQK